MADKKFYGIDGAVSSQALTEDFNAAKPFDRVRVGALGVYYNEGLKMKYIPYDYMDRVFIRIQEVNGKLCCGSTVFQYFRLVFVHGGKEFADVINENEKAADAALECIRANAPQVAIGFVRAGE